jgi:c-di-GMP-binding flagellar brake protein YcgR
MTPRTLPPAGSRVELTVTTERGLFSGPAVVLRREEATQALHLTLAGELEKLQRRQYFRIDVDFAPQTSAVLSPGGVPAESVRVRVRSLSGGGLCFEADRALPMDHVVLVALPMEDGAAMAARAAVLESVEVASGCWRTRALFAALPDRDRQRIVRYVQRMQLAQQRHRRG